MEKPADEEEAGILSDFIKNTHEQLRQSFGGDFSDSWTKHVQDKELRAKYAESMKQLATKFWSDQPEECRVTWCYDILRSYFKSSLKGCIEKDMRIACCEIESRETREISSLAEDGCINVDSVVTKDMFPTKLMSKEILEGSQKCRFSNEVCDEKSELMGKFCSLVYGKQSVSFENESDKPVKRRLLDVGSCYNPFKKFGDDKLEVLAIDLTPASPDVLEVDFTQVEVSSNPKCLEERTESRVLQCLPREAFDVVTFCLLLSYIPCPFQRLSFCAKARQLLKYNGLLLITETQSVTPHNNSMLMKQWKLEVENLGFRRIVYENKTHIHAMAFRKVPLWLRRNPVDNQSEKGKTKSKQVSYSLKGSLLINQDKLKADSNLTAKEFSELSVPACKKAKTG